MIWKLAFWRGATERGIKTAAQTLAAYFVIGTTGLLEFDWTTSLSITGAAAVASLLTSIGNADFTAGTTTIGQMTVDVVASPDGRHEALLPRDVD